MKASYAAYRKIRAAARKLETLPIFPFKAVAHKPILCYHNGENIK
jgi:hypothetical protein